MESTLTIWTMKIFLLLIFLITGSTSLFGQHPNNLLFKELKKVNCNGVNEKSSEKKQLRCMLVDVVEDGINYFPSLAMKTKKPVNSPEKAWEELKELYPQYEAKEFNCWTEYNGYYIFSLNCGMQNSDNECFFLCMIYIPIGGNEFWYFVPRT